MTLYIYIYDIYAFLCIFRVSIQPMKARQQTSVLFSDGTDESLLNRIPKTCICLSVGSPQVSFQEKKQSTSFDSCGGEDGWQALQWNEVGRAAHQSCGAPAVRTTGLLGVKGAEKSTTTLQTRAKLRV